MNERKAVFFDVDGTLFKQGKNVPKSTIRAIAKIRENGHLAFVCTGRSRVMVPKTPILDIGFDGVVAACGMYADYQGKLLFAEEMRQEVLDDILPVLQRTETMYILEGTEYIYYDENTIGNAIDDWYIDAIRTMIPSIINQFIITLKDTSILSVIGFPELVNTAKNVNANIMRSLEVWFIVGVMYLIVITLLSRFAKRMERRLNRGRQ